jgi:hypothetical protein
MNDVEKENEGESEEEKKDREEEEYIIAKRLDCKRVYGELLEKNIDRYDYQVRDVAYVIKDPAFGELKIYQSFKAWWVKDKLKVNKLIDAFKQGHMVKDAMFYAGITEMQYKYFTQVHPGFKEIKKGLNSMPRFRARNTMIADLDNPKTAKWYLEKTDPEFKTKKTIRDLEPEDENLSDIDFYVERFLVDFNQSAIDWLDDHLKEHGWTMEDWKRMGGKDPGEDNNGEIKV